MSKSRAFILAALLLACLPTVPTAAATASLSVVFTNNGEPLPEESKGRFYVYEEEKRERYLAWGNADRPARVEEGTYDVVIRYTHDTIVREHVLESIELKGEMIHEQDFVVTAAHLTIEVTSGGVPVHVHAGSYDVHVAGTRGKPLASRRPGERITVATGRYDIEVFYRDPQGLQSIWLTDYLVNDEHLETVDIGVASARLRVSMTYHGIPVSRIEGEWEAHRPGDPQPLAGGLSGELADLPTGVYDVRAFYRGLDAEPIERWVRDIEVEGNVHETIEIIEETPSDAVPVIVRVRRAGEPLRDAWYSVYAAGTTDVPLVSNRSGDPAELSPGVYDIHATYRKGTLRMDAWFRDRGVVGPAELDLDLPLQTASLTVRPPRRIRDAPERSSVLILLDSSLEMGEAMDGRPRSEWVRETLLDTIGLLDKETIDFGLRVWGIAPLSQNNCRDSTLMLPPGPLNESAVAQVFDLIRPSGLSPIARSLQDSAAELPLDGRSTVVVVTGGIESCSGDVCEAAARLLRDGRADRIHVIGLDQPRHHETRLECAGSYHAAADRGSLRNSLRSIFRETARSDRGRVHVFRPGRDEWIASAELGQSIRVPEGRYDVRIRAGGRVFEWSDFEIRGDITETAKGRR